MPTDTSIVIDFKVSVDRPSLARLDSIRGALGALAERAGAKGVGGDPKSPFTDTGSRAAKKMYGIPASDRPRRGSG